MDKESADAGQGKGTGLQHDFHEQHRKLQAQQMASLQLLNVTDH
jgi:hypothetical protein